MAPVQMPPSAYCSAMRRLPIRMTSCSPQRVRYSMLIRSFMVRYVVWFGIGLYKIKEIIRFCLSGRENSETPDEFRNDGLEVGVDRQRAVAVGSHLVDARASRAFFE